MNRIFGAVIFGLLWTIAMWWLNRPLDWVPLLILALCGAVGGCLFYLASRYWLGWIERRDRRAARD